MQFFGPLALAKMNRCLLSIVLITWLHILGSNTWHWKSLPPKGTQMTHTPSGSDPNSTCCNIYIFDKACRGCNPKDEWAYKDETFGYRIQSLWFKRTSNASAHPKYESEKILLRWMNEKCFLSMDLAASNSKG